MDLVHRLEPGGRLGREHAGQAGREPGADDERDAASLGFGAEVEQAADILDGVRHGHDRDAPGDERARQLDVQAGGGGEHDHVGLDRRVVRPSLAGGLVTEGRGDLVDARRSQVPQHDLLDRVGRGQLTSGARPDRAETEDGDAHQVRSSGVSSRQPPRCGGVPPVPRARSTAATMPAIPRATSALRIRVTATPRYGTAGVRPRASVGLAGIEPATSPLSGVRSNRLSYSPGASDDRSGSGLRGATRSVGSDPVGTGRRTRPPAGLDLVRAQLSPSPVGTRRSRRAEDGRRCPPRSPSGGCRR